MALDPRVEALRVQLDNETTRIAGVVADLSAKVAAGQLSNDEIVDALTPIADRLKAVAHDPNQPVPPEPTPA